MGDKIIRPERRRLEQRQDRLSALGAAVDEALWAERRIHCWNLEPGCTEFQRRKCAAHFVRRNCWDLWAAEYFPPGRKPCCHPEADCSECAVATAKFGQAISVFVEVPSGSNASPSPAPTAARSGIHCPNLYSVKEPCGARGETELRLVFKCQRRRGIALHSTYVSEVCGAIHHRECTFYGAQ